MPLDIAEPMRVSVHGLTVWLLQGAIRRRETAPRSEENNRE